MKRILTILLAAALLLGVLPTASAENLTAQQEAVVQTAIAYYLKNPYVQYDSVVITKRGVGDGGVQRNSDRATPEDATADRTVYAVCSSFACMVYLNALGYDMGGGGSFPPTAAMFNMTGDIVVMKYEAGGDMTAAEATQKVQSLVQPGDIFVVRRTTNTGHAMVYVGDIDGDGKGELLHSTTTGGGGKFDMEKGEDKIEPNGAIHNDDAFDTRMSEKELSGDNISGFILLRPLAAGAKNCAPTEAAAQRVKYPWFAYERTVSCGFYGSPATGDDLTYTIKLTNKSTGAYTVPVTETVPDGTALKDAPDAQVSGGKLSWSVPLAAGESKTVSYTVTVTAPRGTVITAGGGTAAGIESNVLRNRVSGKQPDAAKLQNKDAWADAVIAEAPDGLEIADAIYRHALGVDLKLTDAKALLEPCFKIVSDNDMLRSEQISTAAGDGNAMIVDGFLGGKLILTPADERVLELRSSYLQAGDIFVAGGNLGMKSAHVYVSSGSKLYTYERGKIIVVKEAELVRQFKSNIFLCLRPCLAYDDITAMPYTPPSFADVAKADWFYPYVTTLAQKGVVNGMTATTFAPNGNLTYGQALKLIAKAVGEADQPAGAHWASGYLTLAKNKGWLTADVDLNANITRLALCRIAAKAKGLTEQPKKNPFTDTDDPDVLALNAAGIINGMTETTFQPDGLLTRAQISKIICGMLKV